MNTQPPVDRPGRAHLRNPRPTCCRCGRLLRIGEPHWAGDPQGRIWHYACAEQAGVTTPWVRPRRRHAPLPEPS